MITNDRNDKEENINDNINYLRTRVIDVFEKAATVSGKSDVAEKYETQILTNISDFEAELNTPTETMSSIDLYKPLSENYEQPNLKINILLSKYTKHLDEAIRNYDDEIDRENEMALFSRLFYELDYFKYDNQNYKEIVNAMRVGVFYKKDTFKREEIIVLRDTIRELIDNINITDDRYFDILNKLSNYLNIAGPLSTVSVQPDKI
ncbi:MAG: hypothetical protein HQL61_01220 [Magnetococcales bacterium]|nr:hypothetical protein [Nitrospirota bacterium]